MKLYLVRHAPAVARQVGRPDFGRALTARGAARMRRVARAMHRLGIEPAAIYTSPLLRARQTADILARQWSSAPQPRLADGLRPAGRIGPLLREIAAEHRRPESAVLLVGHEPALGALLSVLLAGHARAVFRFRKGGFCRLEVPGGRLRLGRCATLEWFVDPRMLRKSVSRRP